MTILAMLAAADAAALIAWIQDDGRGRASDRDRGAGEDAMETRSGGLTA